MIRRPTITSAVALATTAVAATVRRPPDPAPMAPPVPEMDDHEDPATDAGRWLGEDLGGLPRQPLYTMAATRGVPERRLAQMSREKILALLQPGRAVRAS